MCIRRVCGHPGVNPAGAVGFMSNPHHTPAESSQPGEGAQVSIRSPSSHRWGLLLRGISYPGCQQAQVQGSGSQRTLPGSRVVGAPRLRSTGQKPALCPLIITGSQSRHPHSIAPSSSLPQDHGVRQAGSTSVCQWPYSQGPAPYLARKHCQRIRSVSYKG